MSALKCLAISLLLLSYCEVYAQGEVPLSWQSAFNLSWKDFKGEVSVTSDAVASTATGITFGYAIGNTNNTISSFKAEVYAHFYPLRSWVKPEGLNAYVLEHEQLHFDITELHARLLRKELLKLRISDNLKQRVQALHDRISADLDRMQSLYDLDTRHSLDKAAQERWKKEVSLGLKALESYSHPEVLVSRN